MPEPPEFLADDLLISSIERLIDAERERLADFIALLGEIDRRKLPVKLGYSSTFDYCVRRLRLSEDEACRRIQAARAAVRRPELLPAMTEGQLSLTAVSRLAPHVGHPDAPELIARAEGKSLNELEVLLAPLRPERDKKDRVRSLSVIVPSKSDDSPAKIDARVEFSFQGPPGLRVAIERAKDLLSNKYPFGGLSEILLEVVQDYLARHDPQRPLKLTEKGATKMRAADQTAESSAADRHAGISAATRRAVWARDGGRCVYVGPGGIRCQSRRLIEIDHVLPRAKGGGHEVENLRLLCRPHNDAERRRVLGEGELFTHPSRDGSVDN